MQGTAAIQTEPKVPQSDAILQDEYNNAPYQSFSFNYTHPAHLYTIAKLFGLKPKPIDKARILELGCASGGNIIPIAFNYPNAEILGIDLAERQIEEGVKQIDELGLKNITLKHQSLMNFDAKEGKFDYIICHGVYSWVDDEARDKILKICNENLSKNGIAYISYNTFPGWNSVKSFRELMQWHTKDIKDPAQKAQQARAVLTFISNGLAEDKSPYAEFLRNELNLLSKHSDSYLLHDHLSSYNDPVYFYQFMDKANTNQLSYLADAFLATMFTDNLPPKLASELKKINNIVATGQYMDFVRNQRFRCTLLTHQDQKINRALKTTDIEQFYVQFTGQTDKPNFTEKDINSGQEVSFYNNLLTLKVRNPLSQLAMHILYQEQHKPILYNELCQKILAKSPGKKLEEIKQHLNDDLNLMRCVLAGLISISTYPGDYLTQVSEMPTACPLVRHQALKQTFVTNRRHQAIGLDPFARILMPYLDGTHSMKSLVNILQEQLDEGKLTMLDENGQPLTDKDEIRRRVPLLCERTLQNMAYQALLVK